MAKLKHYDIDGKELGEIDVNDAILVKEVSHQQVKDYLVAIRRNKRQWSASTKGRSDINHSNAKPHAQKGTGKARQGTIKAPQYRGGGVVFGPKPKFDQFVKINRQERRKAISYLLSDKMAGDNVICLKMPTMEKASTKTFSKFLKKVGLERDSILFVDKECHPVSADKMFFYLSMRNIKRMRFRPVESLSGEDVIRCKKMIVLDSAVEELTRVMECK
ncbi:50S ribosomal protein L4 [Candidatus Aerophobetes bacterium]|uniref:Large ribosomal subunit protein uL4 n=1 Tax=Aerophobetes bacterium TaxID=2030807 RepID=A0A2A4X7A3_UNCAE|nr:MAG: 50S ribosomal protein L4 [Candidatus Aerophobetes bacterium]